MPRETDPATAGAELYLELMKTVLLREGFGVDFRPVDPERPVARAVYRPLAELLRTRGLQIVRVVDDEFIAQGRGWRMDAETMIGRRRLDNLQDCITDVLEQSVPGDLAETGVWRGGASIFMRAVLKVYGDRSRVVWAADSFEGLPPPRPEQYPQDAGDEHWKARRLAVPLADVKANFARYGLLDDQVQFLVGWFQDTLPGAPIEKLSILRLDGDMYESTIVALDALYPKLSVGGYVIVDDYGAVEGCRAAVDDFRARNAIDESVKEIDWTGVYWKRLK